MMVNKQWPPRIVAAAKNLSFESESFRNHDLIWMGSSILNSAFLRPLVQEMSIVVLDNKTQDMLILEDMNIMGLI